MLRQLFKSMVVARQAYAAIETLNHMSDRQLEDIGFTRANYVEKIKASVLAELDAQDAAKALKAPFTCLIFDHYPKFVSPLSSLS